jgi:ArsR family transcriptional regulator
MDSLVFLKSISNETKLRLINLLLDNELCVCELEEILGIRQANISKNLISLKESGIVNVRRDKQRGFYYLTSNFNSQAHLIKYLRSLQVKEEVLKKDYNKFLSHEEVKDNKIYVCNAYKSEVE